jgi:hypothetical protein
MDEQNPLLKYILDHDHAWSTALNIYNPYLDKYSYSFIQKLPVFDSQGYAQYPEHNFVYDKLWIAQSQDIKCGKVIAGELPKQQLYPIFIKPRWGHKTATSKNCFKIDSLEKLRPYMDISGMIWTEFIDETEGMTDFVLLNGQPVYQMTLEYSKAQIGFIDEWKYVSPKTKPPDKIIEWVNSFMSSYTGIANVQYRGDKIIEVSLRLARGGAYILSTNNRHLVENINKLVKHEEWDYTVDEKLGYKPFYSIKCYTTLPIIYLIPQFFLDKLMDSYGTKEFYEYYFEPNGKNGMVFFQFMHNDLKQGQKLKSRLETIFNIAQICAYLAILLVAYILIASLFAPNKFAPNKFAPNKFAPAIINQHKTKIIVSIVILFLTTLINPFGMQYNLYKSQKQRYS